MIKIATGNISDKIFIIVSWQWYAIEYTVTRSIIKRYPILCHFFDIHAVLTLRFIWIVKYKKRIHKKFQKFCDLWMIFRILGFYFKFKVKFLIQISYRYLLWNSNTQLNKWKTKLMSKMKEVTVLKYQTIATNKVFVFCGKLKIRNYDKNDTKRN